MRELVLLRDARRSTETPCRPSGRPQRSDQADRRSEVGSPYASVTSCGGWPVIGHRSPGQMNNERGAGNGDANHEDAAEADHTIGRHALAGHRWAGRTAVVSDHCHVHPCRYGARGHGARRHDLHHRRAEERDGEQDGEPTPKGMARHGGQSYSLPDQRVQAHSSSLFTASSGSRSAACRASAGRHCKIGRHLDGTPLPIAAILV